MISAIYCKLVRDIKLNLDFPMHWFMLFHKNIKYNENEKQAQMPGAEPERTKIFRKNLKVIFLVFDI